MEVSEKLGKMILAEITRLSRAIREKNAPIGGIQIMGLLIEMLVGVLAGKISFDDLLEVLSESKASPKIIEYYVEFFKVSSHA